ncbi:hypothetical protein BBI17_001694 [Phytophthora kernoviae]|uniref:Elicitin-like protein n=2 Tax=Phytophthora kernoviae TaxID=325452 RepID=A0A421ES77_9STRA|nr:hypothetical protein G195_006907 [Phytophthora kernoviae 00238/432]RLM96054.1 hypothetical protein BBI17_001694 [Phytophthora kernoviae]
MIKITPNSIALFVMGLVMLQTCTVDAANCTTDELTTAKSIYSDLTSGDACSELISNTEATSLDYCMNNDCLSALSDAVDQLPDCTGDDEIDYKTGSTDTDSSGTAESGAIGARGAMTTAVLFTQTSVAIYFFAGLL